MVLAEEEPLERSKVPELRWDVPCSARIRDTPTQRCVGEPAGDSELKIRPQERPQAPLEKEAHRTQTRNRAKTEISPKRVIDVLVGTRPRTQASTPRRQLKLPNITPGTEQITKKKWSVDLSISIFTCEPVRVEIQPLHRRQPAQFRRDLAFLQGWHANEPGERSGVVDFGKHDVESLQAKAQTRQWACTRRALPLPPNNLLNRVRRYTCQNSDRVGTTKSVQRAYRTGSCRPTKAA